MSNADCCTPAPNEGAAEEATADARGPLVQILYFDGCPNHHPAIALVERVSRELGIEPELQLVDVPDQEAAQRLRFLGSPTIRVGGVDVDPRTQERDDYALSCRLFQTEAGISGQPDEMWIREALVGAQQREAVARPAETFASRSSGMNARSEQGEVVQRALSAAGIAPQRFGPARLTRLSESERKLYRWILKSFAHGGQPQVDELSGRASDVGLQIEDTLATFASLDLVHHDPATGEILVAYPFSARPRGHFVVIDGKHRVEAMCAIDALGIAAMLELQIEIYSHDPRTGGEIWVRVDPGEGAWWEPTTAVVLTGSACCKGPSFRGCCDVLDFFQSTDSADSYLGDHPDLAGFAISIPDAIEAGRTVFADLMKEP